MPRLDGVVFLLGTAIAKPVLYIKKYIACSICQSAKFIKPVPVVAENRLVLVQQIAREEARIMIFLCVASIVLL
jgi:hypothetical protein